MESTEVLVKYLSSQSTSHGVANVSPRCLIFGYFESSYCSSAFGHFHLRPERSELIARFWLFLRILDQNRMKVLLNFWLFSRI